MKKKVVIELIITKEFEVPDSYTENEIKQLVEYPRLDKGWELIDVDIWEGME